VGVVMKREVQDFLYTICLSALLVLVFTGCGGGTTGTSGTSELRFLGSAARGDGSPIAEEPMDVIDEATQLQLLASGTDKRGDFEMTLPRPSLGVVVEIQGARTPPITSGLAGSVTISAALLQKEEGEISVSAAFSASPRLLTTCSSFAVNGNTVKLSGQNSIESCTLLVGVESSSLLSQMKIALTAKCGGKLRTFAEDTVQGARGLGSVDLSLVDYSSCIEPRVEVIDGSGRLTPITFEISRF
jgi:hypothetical protein